MIKGLKYLKVSDIPPEANAALLNCYKYIRYAQNHYLAFTTNRQDLEDSESEAFLQALKFVRAKIKEDKDSEFWNRKTWQKHILRRINNAVLEYSKYVYLPIVLPRPIRFSLKKYIEAMRLINKYVKYLNYVTDSDLYYVVCKKGCSPLLQNCSCEYPICPLRVVSPEDRKKLHHILFGEEKSLQFYAAWYRKTYREWIDLLEILFTYTLSSEIPDKEVVYDLEGSIDLDKFNGELKKIDQNLPEIYYLSMENIDVDHMNNKLIIESPKGWKSKEIKNKFNLTSEKLQKYLHEGDRVLNNFRTNLGLPRIRRKVSKQPSG